MHYNCIPPQDPIATVTSVTSKPKSKWRPLPLDTVVRTKAAVTHLHLRSHYHVSTIMRFNFFTIVWPIFIWPTDNKCIANCIISDMFNMTDVGVTK